MTKANNAIDIDPEIREKLLELKERQEEEIQKKIDSGEIIDFSHKNINGNGKPKKKKNEDKEQPKQDKESRKEKKRELITYKYSKMQKGT